MKVKIPRRKQMVAWLLAISLLMGNLAQTVTVKAELAGAAGAVVYYVNCGGTALPEGENYGAYSNGAVDQPYDAEGAEFPWGYDSGYEYETDEYAGQNVRMVKGDDGAALSYYFTLPRGDYQVEVGMPHCNHWGNRVVNLDLQVGEGQKQSLIADLNTTNDIAENTVKSVTGEFSVSEEKQLVTVSAVRSNANAWAPFLGFIKIRDKNVSEDDGLEAAIEAARVIYEAQDAAEKYTARTWKAFQEAYEASLEIKDSADADHEARKLAAQTLDRAVQGLKEKPGEEQIDKSAAYYVNCGGTQLPEGARYGIYNDGEVDQAYDVNGAAEFNWGYDSSYEYETAEYAGRNVRLVKGDDAAALSYYFTLPRGNYRAEVMIPYCSYSGNRVLNIDLQVEGGKKQNLISNLNTTNDIEENTVKSIIGEFAVSEERSVVTISAVRSNEQAWAPFFGDIKITDNSAPEDDGLASALAAAKPVYETGNADNKYTSATWTAFADAYVQADGLKDSTDTAAKKAAAQKLKAAQTGLEQTPEKEEPVSGVVYYINCGGTSLPAGESYGLYNEGVADQAYDENGPAKYNWGYDSHFSYDTTVTESNYSGHMVRLIAGNDAATLAYYFELPKGDYQVDVDIPYCTHFGNRVMNVDLKVGEGQKQNLISNLNTTDDIPQNTLKRITGDFTVDEGKQVVTVSAVRSNENAWAPFLGYIKITAKNKLQDALDRAAALYEAGNANAYYTADSWAAFQGAYEEAFALKGSDDRDARSAAADKLEKARKGLRKTSAGQVETGVLYFVDCGNEGLDLAGTDRYGQYNRIPDQKLASDAETGKTWGWGKIGENDPETGTNSRAKEDTKEFTYQAAGPGSDFYYEFDLPADLYQVEITVPYFMNGSTPRTFEVLASSGPLGAEYETVANNINTKYIDGAARTYTAVCTADGTKPLCLSFLSDSDAWGPIVSAIKISAVSADPYIESLKLALQKAKSYPAQDYSDVSYEPLAAAIRQAEEKLSAITNAKEAKELEDALRAGIKKLQSVKSLREWIAKAKAYPAADYTADSYAKLQTAIQTAEKQLGSVTSVSQAMKLEDAVQAAIDGLVKKEPEKPPVVNPPASVFYQVTFDSAGGSAVSAQNVKSGQKASEPKKPTRRNYLFQGWYVGSAKYDFNKAVTGNVSLKAKWKKVTVGTPKISSVKNSKSRQCTVKIKKVSGAAGYEVSYTTDKKFKKSIKKASGRKNQIILKKLKKGKTYYVKARAYQNDSKGQKVYGKFSGIKKVKIKK